MRTLKKVVNLIVHAFRRAEVLLNPKAYGDKTIEDRWIRTDEKMPEKGEEVLACDIDGDIHIGWMHDRTHLATVDDYYKNIIAWMPLPEPYKESEDT